MEIKLNSWDMEIAMQDYLKKKYNIDVDLNNLSDYPCLEYYEYQIAYKKHKNGKHILDKNGCSIVDRENCKNVKMWAELSDAWSISFYLD